MRLAACPHCRVRLVMPMALEENVKCLGCGFRFQASSAVMSFARWVDQPSKSTLTATTPAEPRLRIRSRKRLWWRLTTGYLLVFGLIGGFSSIPRGQPGFPAGFFLGAFFAGLLLLVVAILGVAILLFSEMGGRVGVGIWWRK